MPFVSSLAPVVLIVEDDALIREMIASEVEYAGFNVVESETAEESLRLLEAEKPALLFTDIRLAGKLTGWQLAEEARRLIPNLPIIYATGYTEQPLRIVPGAVFIHKPYRPSEIVRHMRRLLGEADEGAAANT